MTERPAAANPETLLAAVRAFQAGDWVQAENRCQQLLAANPRHADALHILGLTLSRTGRNDAAIDVLQAATVVQPNSAVLWSNLGTAYSDAGRLAEAASCQRKAIALDQNFFAAFYNLSAACTGLGETEAAIAAARRATELQPDYGPAFLQLGNLLCESGRLEEALPAYQAAVRTSPGSAEAHHGLGAVWLQLRRPAEALAQFREALRLEPASIAAQKSIGDALHLMGRVVDAKAAYAHAADAQEPMRALAIESLAEWIASDHVAIETYHARIGTAVQTFAAAPGKINLAALHPDGARPSMMLAYYGGNVRPIMEQYAQAIAPHIPPVSLPPRQAKPKLGIVVTNGHERVFAQCWGGIAERLSRELFDVRVVCSRGGANTLHTLLTLPREEYVILPDGVDTAANLLGEQGFDWLHYWEIGTDAMNYFLPFFRPARGQSACWGWPVTSGNPCVDSYLSCEHLEPPEGSTHYTERLVLLEHLPTYYVRPHSQRLSETLEARPRDTRQDLRSRFGLEEGRHVFLCTQNLRKYHPDFDGLLAEVLRGDPQGNVLIIAYSQPAVTELLLNRFQRTMPDVASRVRVMPRAERAKYLELVAAADVVLDTLHYGAGANTAYDAAAIGVPLVTLPGRFHRSLWAAAVNRRLGVSRLIAASPQEYVATAIAVASDADLWQSLHEQIRQRAPELFEDAAVVREHDAYFSEAIAATRAV
jgi:predicted O-linked N-acetylglucosamine transferase (SPINDLY family)